MDDPTAVCSWLGIKARWDVVDVGAGTGQASRVFRAAGAHVVAVEPEPEPAMHQLITSRVDDVDARLGSAETLPVVSDSADLVASVSAWHWFDQNRAFDEAARVLRQGGVLGLIWNGMDHTDPWARRFLAATETADGTTISPDHRPGPHSLRAPAGSPFRDIETVDVPWTWSRSIDQVLGLIGTYSVFVNGDSELRDRISTSAAHPLDQREHNDRVIALPMRARCWKAWKSGRGL
jgi:SAM-dependent methyltransferase